MAAAGRMNVLRARLRELPARERFWTTVAVVAVAAALGWWLGDWFGVVAGVAIASKALLGKPRQQKPPTDADAERLERDLQHRRDQAFQLFRPGEPRSTPPPEDDDERDYSDAQYLEMDMEHRRRQAARLFHDEKGGPGAAPLSPPRPPAPSRTPAVLFPPDPRPLPPAPTRAELFKDAPPPPRPIVEEGGGLFRRRRRGRGSIVE